ncbi:unnamed protein product [Rotaria magnacalcarata]|uniref:Uncharacterized protein n=1 Tax=Rotaria magnacalcarata TaxID=392030 RepID=A0A816U1E0_9BILA|nr:unnamed protein product [Rotaria magnacalcarata]CAF4190444.1 unnamed protein product [Rotaria magnacalcarata]
MLPDSLLNRTQLCQINCTQNQTMFDSFKEASGCIKSHFKICFAYLTMDFSTHLVSYSFTTADGKDHVNENASLIRPDLVTNYFSYIKTEITAIRFRQLKMKLSKTNPHQLTINYFCRTQIDDFPISCLEIETIHPVHIANQHLLKRI